MAACPLFQRQSLYLLRPYVRDFAQNALGLFPLDAWEAGYIARH